MAQLEGYYFSAALSCTFLVSCLLFSAFSRALREPYMDEIFHLPQAQRYCEGHFSLSQKLTEAWKTELQKKKEERLPPVRGPFSEFRKILRFLLAYSTSFKNLSALLLLTWPYGLLALLFCAFVAVNGGVVIGDRSSHEAYNRHYTFYVWKRVFQRHEIVRYLLVCELGCYAVINFLTFYIFLHKTFQWPDSPDTQRFMW
ncbi:hypothetical protein CB1_000731037 [Camelus ferus]|nr:hypothetical protein CB1_000731037 [Camelus ferus]